MSLCLVYSVYALCLYNILISRIFKIQIWGGGREDKTTQKVSILMSEGEGEVKCVYYVFISSIHYDKDIMKTRKTRLLGFSILTINPIAQILRGRTFSLF